MLSEVGMFVIEAMLGITCSYLLVSYEFMKST